MLTIRGLNFFHRSVHFDGVVAIALRNLLLDAAMQIDSERSLTLSMYLAILKLQIWKIFVSIKIIKNLNIFVMPQEGFELKNYVCFMLKGTTISH